jgi:hypothetical protein
VHDDYTCGVNTISALRSLIHLVVMLSIVSWGFLAWSLPLPGLAIGVGLLVAVILLWALFLSPKPVLALDKFGRSIVEILLIGAAVAALLSLGVFWPVPIALGVVGLLLGFLAER